MDDNADYHFKIGTNAMLRGDGLTASVELTKALNINRDNAPALFNVSQLLHNSELYQAGYLAAKRAAKLDPLSYQFAWQHGYMLGCVGKYEECELELRRSIYIQDNFHARHWLGMCMYHVGRFSDGIKHYDRAAELAPENSKQVTNDRACCYLGLGDFHRGFIDNKIMWDELAPLIRYFI